MFDELFWKNVVNVWINVQTKEDREQTKRFAEELAQNIIGSKKEKVRSILDELFGEEDLDDEI